MTRQSEWAKKNRAKVNAYQRAYRKAHRALISAGKMRNRARKKAALTRS